jgi:hypothetical protein
MASDDETTAGRWDKDQLRIDDGPADPLPPRSGDEVVVADDAGEVLVADVVVADPVTGVVAEDVIVATTAGSGTDASGSGDEGRSAPGWNKGQMAIDDGDEAQPRYDPDTMPESETGPTGGRANPGGGERFGEIDDTRPEERGPDV